MLEGAFLAGLIAGPYTGAIVGRHIALPALFAGEWGAVPFAVGCGFAGGGIREASPKEAHLELLAVRLLQPAPLRLAHAARAARSTGRWRCCCAPIGLEAHSPGASARASARIACSTSRRRRSWLTVAIYVATVLTVSIPIKIWNNARIEHRLQEQEKLLLAAKIEALKSQINPHFLFNTLTLGLVAHPIAAGDRAHGHPEALGPAAQAACAARSSSSRCARSSNRSTSIWTSRSIRFGPRLGVRKDIAPDTLDVIVPSMILQPLVENAIKHGLTRKVGAGHITIRSRARRRHAHSSTSKTTGSASRTSGCRPRCRAASA